MITRKSKVEQAKPPRKSVECVCFSECVPSRLARQAGSISNYILLGKRKKSIEPSFDKLIKKIRRNKNNKLLYTTTTTNLHNPSSNGNKNAENSLDKPEDIREKKKTHKLAIQSRAIVAA